MIDGLKFIQMDSANNITGVIADDHDTNPFDTEDDFNKNSIYWSDLGYRCYYFGGGDDGAMRTNKTTIDIDGDRFSFYFEKSGGHKGAGLTGEKDDKFYQSGKLITAGKDEKYQVVEKLLRQILLVRLIQLILSWMTLKTSCSRMVLHLMMN